MKKELNILIVEDDEYSAEALELVLSQYGKCTVLTSISDLQGKVKQSKPDIVFTDLSLNEELDGLKSIKIAKENEIYCVVVTGNESEDVVKMCLEAGADDYYVKGTDYAFLKEIIQNLIQPESTNMKDWGVVTTNKQYQADLEFVISVASNQYPILVIGETGTGKTHIAKLIHEQSGRKGDFVSINCSSIPENLFESTLFGHKKGSFTGATSDAKGLLLQADLGTVYFDEIDSMPLNQQAKLLKAIEDKEFYPVGSSKAIKADFRIISSSQVDLARLDSFRQDLYYRLQTIQLKIPALRERKDDIIPILKSYLVGNKKYAFSDQASKLLQQYSWAGNIREVQKVASSIKISSKNLVTEDFLTPYLETVNIPSKLINDDIINSIETDGFEKLLIQLKSEIKNHYIEQLGSKTKAQEKLGLSRSTFWKW